MSASLNLIQLLKSFHENHLSDDVRKFLSHYFQTVDFGEEYGYQNIEKKKSIKTKPLYSFVISNLPFSYYQPYIQEEWLYLDYETIESFFENKEKFQQSQDFLFFALDFFQKKKQKDPFYAVYNKNVYAPQNQKEYSFISIYLKDILLLNRDSNIQAIPFTIYQPLFEKALEVFNLFHNTSFLKNEWFSYYNHIDQILNNSYNITQKNPKENLIEDIVSHKFNSLELTKNIFSQSNIPTNYFADFIRKSLEHKNWLVLSFFVHQKPELVLKTILPIFEKLENSFYLDDDTKNPLMQYIKNPKYLDKLYHIFQSTIFSSFPSKIQSLFLLSKDQKTCNHILQQNPDIQQEPILQFLPKEWSYFYHLILNFQKDIQQLNLMSSSKINSYFPYKFQSKRLISYEKNILLIAQNFYEKNPTPILSQEEKEKIYLSTIDFFKKCIQCDLNKEEKQNSDNYLFIEKQMQKIFLNDSLSIAHIKNIKMKI
jgi:hypothetical protein